MGRGILTKEIKEKAKNFLGRDINVTELRLYPHLDYAMKNSQYIKPERINAEDREILSTLQKEGHIDRFMDVSNDKARIQLSMTRKFYDYINDILWDGYVNY